MGRGKVKTVISKRSNVKNYLLHVNGTGSLISKPFFPWTMELIGLNGGE